MNYFPIGESGKIKVDGEEVSLTKIEFVCYNDSDKKAYNLPHDFYQGQAVLYNGKVYLIGGNTKDILRLEESGSWTKIGETPVSTLFSYGSAVIYNGEIHILGGTKSKRIHYKWDGSTWTSVSTLPYDFYEGSAVIYNGEIHILGGYGGTKTHYKWDGLQWTSVSTLPVGFAYGSAVVYNGEIHILGGDVSGSSSYTRHYKWNLSDGWNNVGEMGYSLTRGSAVVFDNCIYVMGGRAYQDEHFSSKHCYRWDGESWEEERWTPVYFFDGCALVYKNHIHTFGGGDGYFSSNEYRSHYILYAKDYVLSVNN